jgi:1-acyl-sn-glycerol-3-phosphate acyltransferase
MARKKLVTAGYVLVFWVALPGILAALAAWGERVFRPRLHLPNLLPAGLMIALASGVMLALSILQYTRASGGLPISAFPPRQLIRSGVFGVWRHPIYLFSVFFWSGLAMTFWPAGSILIVFPALALGTLVYSKFEEAGLEKRFGRIYDGHRKQTSIIIPRLPHLARPLLSLLSRLFFRFEVSGRENGALAPPFFVISAHRNFLDSLFISLALKVPIHFIITFEVCRKPLSRSIFRKLHCLPKKRYKPDLRNALDVRRRLEEGCAVGIFPEAERSWTGAMLGFKPETLKLLRSFSGIPILPVRLEGTYAVWPRWATGPRRAKVSVAIEKPVFADPGESSVELEARLSRLVEPRQAPDSRSKPPSAAGIESLIYRCPSCLSFDTVLSLKEPGFKCSSCQAHFELLSDFSIRQSGRNASESLASVSRRIRVVTGNSLPAANSPITRAQVRLSVERLGRFEVVGIGRLDLSARDLSFEAGDTSVNIDLASVRSVVIEGARKLQIYGGRSLCLFEFALLGQGALKWQDLVVGVIERRFGFSPTTT